MLTTQIADLVARGATFVVNHSGGKDSQAMYLMLREIVPADQIIHVHADLGRVEWSGAYAHILATTAGEPVLVCRNPNKDLLQMVEHNQVRHAAAGTPEKPVWPSPSQRQCTSDLKRGPIETCIRQYSKRTGRKLFVNCMGMRAEESPNRAKLTTFKLSVSNSVAGREWYDWLPIHDWSVEQVFAKIAAAGQQPHPIYALGMSRFSCVFCIMASQADLETAARLATERPELLNDPHLFREYIEMEHKTGQVMMMPSKKHGKRGLEEITGVYLDGRHRKVIPIKVASAEPEPAHGECMAMSFEA